MTPQTLDSVTDAGEKDTSENSATQMFTVISANLTPTTHQCVDPKQTS